MKKVINITIIVGIVTLLLAIGVKAGAIIAASQVTYNGTTVKAKLDELIEKTTPLSSKVSIGDYVSMTPTNTSYTVPKTLTGYTDNQYINPSELNLWRVIDIREDGTIEMVSEYVSSTDVYLKGQQGYLNFVGTLNLIAEQYENEEYTVNSRVMGYNVQTEFITDTSKFTNTAPWTSATSNNNNEIVGGGDIMYGYDTNSSTGLVYKALGTLVANNPSGTAKAYWLGSRYYRYDSATNYRWNGRLVDVSGDVTNYGLYGYYSGWADASNSRAIRPIVTLKSDITATGLGTSDSPWVLS